MSAVLSTAPATTADAIAHFAARLAFETDVSDVHADLHDAVPGLVVVDSRSAESWDQGHIPGALHLPTAEIPSRAVDVIPGDAVVVTYCWGPGCNGSTRAALAFATLGFRVKEMIGGYEYWVREGFPIETADGTHTQPRDPLTAPLSAITCGC
jgi:rhodanese-related sulfurtransferase